MTPKQYLQDNNISINTNQKISKATLNSQTTLIKLS
jgi:hypothetical protein